ncbi:MAG: ketol-acid reductoisomerase [Candidatus Krumholzibacteria bacterium]|nr:ketol-acid reductoisomerase [Candidatus Krumholzibacteria bacterium]
MFEQYPPIAGTEIVAETVNLSPLLGKTVAIIGYGTMGRAHALNLVRSGVEVVVGSRKGSEKGQKAVQEGLTNLTVAEAVGRADVVMLMLPDEAMAAVYQAEVESHLKPNAALGFAHGFAIAFDQIHPATGRPCFLAAPKGQGDMLLQAHAAGGGVPGLLAVTDDSPQETWELAAAYTKAVGSLTGGGFVTTFRAECISDQFGEQVVLCGGVIELLKSAFDIMVEAGYGAENAYFECVHELKLITDLLHRHGVDGMRDMISGTASYGGLTRGPRVIDDGVRARMKDILQELEDGRFAGELLARHGETAALAAAEADGPLATTGRAMLPRLHPETDKNGNPKGR